MNIIKKVLLIFIVTAIFTLISNFNTYKVFATSDPIKDIEDSASKFIEEGSKRTNGKDGNTAVNTGELTKNFKGIGQLLTLVGAGVMVGATTYMGIKYMISPPDKQAALKEQLIGLAVSGIVIFGAYGIWKAVVGVVSNFD